MNPVNGMRNVGIVPYPETGHLIPTFKLAKGLKSLGHRVSYFGLPDFEDSVRFEGLDFVPVLDELYPKGFVNEQAVKKGLLAFEALLIQGRKVTPAKPGYSPMGELYQTLKSAQPELLLIDNLLPDIALGAHAAGIPCVLLNTQLFCPWETVAAYKALLNLPELVLCPEEFDFPREQRRRVCHYVEACIDLDRREPDFPWHQVDPERPLIYCALGTMSHVFEQSGALLRCIIDAVAMSSTWQLILAAGAQSDLASFGPLPSNVVAVSRAPQLQILRRASLMISHGGFNSVKECIYFGVPMILFPTMGDTPQVTARVQYHGLGLRGSIRNVTSQQICFLIDTVANKPSFKTQIEIMRERFVEAEKAQRAIQTVETLLSQPRSRIN